jgi:hypothetical protein
VFDLTVILPVEEKYIAPPDPVALHKSNTQLVRLSEADPLKAMAPPFPA